MHDTAKPDPSLAPRLHRGAVLLVLVAFLAFALTMWRYLTPLSGITGSGGAMLAALGAAALVLGGLGLTVLPIGGARTTLLALCWLGATLTLVALLLLHSWWAAGLLAIGLFAMVIESIAPARGAR